MEDIRIVMVSMMVPARQMPVRNRKQLQKPVMSVKRKGQKKLQKLRLSQRKQQQP